MKIYIISAFTFLSFGLKSQITINETDFLQSGDSVGISTSTNLAIDFSTTGPNSTWDFSGLTETEYLYEKAKSMSSAGFIINIQFGPFAPTEYRASYFQNFDGLPMEDLTSFLPIQINSINRMIKIDNNKLSVPGYSLETQGQVIGFKSDTIETAYEFPINYGDIYSSTGYTDINLSPAAEARIKMNRKRQSEVDGYGQITTPDGTYDALRIKHVVNEMDSIYIELGPIQQWIPINRTNSEYEWWAKNKKRPVLKVETETIAGNEVPTRITYINSPPVGLDHNTLETKVYPNPTDKILNIESVEVIDSVKVFSTDGRQVFEQETSGMMVTLDLSNLTPGVYTVQAISQKAQSFKSIVIK
ncbi:T9SS type A sorting domain-containing protein [Brumimicrobium oceani]|uniref:Secretion system C-terminal sorting domain-containing protein n=1 Tax=Brumimicrobium oceani TaxID=2100725 RepID=A0A2U2XGA7_9FLAO|nr:T9SS type A sorting domain-containing protein [Brumimicrobium oceani]PWH86838.1 hypothetical protein DIT68_00830 [Brumimicrobium oceani]